MTTARTAADRATDLAASEADKLWTRVTEIGDQVGEVDKSVGVLTSEVHSMRSGIGHIEKALREFIAEQTNNQRTNWGLVISIIGVAIVIITGGYSLVEQRIRHTDETAEMRDSHTREVMQLHEDRLEWRMRAEGMGKP